MKKNNSNTEPIPSLSKTPLMISSEAERKTIFDYYAIFRIYVGCYYHAFDYACQVCNKSFKLYEDSKTDAERELNWHLAKIIAKSLNPPIPINNFSNNKQQKPRDN